MGRTASQSFYQLPDAPIRAEVSSSHGAIHLPTPYLLDGLWLPSCHDGGDGRRGLDDHSLRVGRVDLLPLDVLQAWLGVALQWRTRVSILPWVAKGDSLQNIQPTAFKGNSKSLAQDNSSISSGRKCNTEHKRLFPSTCMMKKSSNVSNESGYLRACKAGQHQCLPPGHSLYPTRYGLPRGIPRLELGQNMKQLAVLDPPLGKPLTLLLHPHSQRAMSSICSF